MLRCTAGVVGLCVFGPAVEEGEVKEGVIGKRPSSFLTSFVEVAQEAGHAAAGPACLPYSSS